jgi:hypothetical protein
MAGRHPETAGILDARFGARTRASPPGFMAVSLLCAQLLATSATADNVVVGWLSPAQDNWPLIAIHAALTPDGRVLSCGTDGSGTQTGYFIYDAWDPSAGLSNGHITLAKAELTAQLVDPSLARRTRALMRLIRSGAYREELLQHMALVLAPGRHLRYKRRAFGVSAERVSRGCA